MSSNLTECAAAECTQQLIKKMGILGEELSRGMGGQLAVGVRRLERLLAEHHFDDYGRQARAYIRAGNVPDAGRPAALEPFTHTTSAVDFARLAVAAFAGEYFDPSSSRAAARTLQCWERLGNGRLGELVSADFVWAVREELWFRHERSMSRGARRLSAPREFLD